MRKLGKGLQNIIADLAGDSDQARINLRASQVRARYRAVIECVYPTTANLFLAHTNNVYIMKKEDVPTLIVYVDESIFSAELNAQRELIKLKLLESFGEQIENFEIHVSRGRYKDNHPFVSESEGVPVPVLAREPLGRDEEDYVNTVTATVENETVRTSLQKAMTADLERKRAELGSAEQKTPKQTRS